MRAPKHCIDVSAVRSPHKAHIDSIYHSDLLKIPPHTSFKYAQYAHRPVFTMIYHSIIRHMKVQAKQLSEAERIETLDALYTAAGTVHGRDAMKVFLRDLLTESERIMLGRRIIIARRLIASSTYDDIATELKVGYDTIHRIQRWLHDQMPGYEKAVQGMEKEFEKRKMKKLYATSALARLKLKYPGHFLLFPFPKNKE